MLRNFLYAFHDEALMEAAKAGRGEGTIAFIPKENAPPAGLAHVNQALVHAVAARGRGIRATLDHDATIQESHKREVDWEFMEERSDAFVSATEVEFLPGNWPKTAEPMRYVVCASRSGKANSSRAVPTHGSSQW